MKLACLHAHYSNIEYIEKALSTFELELIHFVDPGLIDRLTNDEHFLQVDAERKVKEQLDWIAKTNADAILITCTNYIALLQGHELSMTIPIIKIDEPFFEAICQVDGPQIILFTNPATVDGTMGRLTNYAKNNGKVVDIEAIVVEHSFDMLMRGDMEKYNQAISECLNQIVSNSRKVVSVAQLSMVYASQQVEQTNSKHVINPLNTLISSIVKQLHL